MAELAEYEYELARAGNYRGLVDPAGIHDMTGFGVVDTMPRSLERQHLHVLPCQNVRYRYRVPI